MRNIHFTPLDNVQVTCKHISTKVSFKITIRKEMFALTFVDLEKKTVFLFGNLK